MSEQLKPRDGTWQALIDKEKRQALIDKLVEKAAAYSHWEAEVIYYNNGRAIFRYPLDLTEAHQIVSG